MIAQAPTYSPATWDVDRLILAMHARGWHTAMDLWMAVNQHRALGDPPSRPISRVTIYNLCTGVSDPIMGRTGHRSLVFELADVLQVSVDWLAGRTRIEPSLSRYHRARWTGVPLDHAKRGRPK